MTAEFLVPLLALLTMGVAVGFAIFNKARVDARRKDPDAPKSSLATDGPNHRAVR